MTIYRAFPGLTALLAAGLFSLVRAQQPLIVESEQGGLNPQFYSETTGPWDHSVAKSTAPGLSPISLGSRIRQLPGEGAPGEVRISPVLPAAGEYEISVTWGKSGNAKHVKYVVETPEGTNTVYLDQDGWGGGGVSNANQWNSLGVFKLPAQGAVVRVLTDEAGGPPEPKNAHRAIADGFRFAVAAAAPAPSATAQASEVSPPLPAASAVPSAALAVSASVSSGPTTPTTATMTSPFTRGESKPTVAKPTTVAAAPSLAGSPFSAPAPSATVPPSVSSPFGATAPARTPSPPPAGSPFTSTVSAPAPPKAAAPVSPFSGPAQPVSVAPAVPVAAQPALPFGSPSAVQPSSPFTASAPPGSSPFGAPPAGSAQPQSPFVGTGAPAQPGSPFAAGGPPGVPPSSPFAASVAPGQAPSPFVAAAPGGPSTSPFGAPPAAMPQPGSPPGAPVPASPFVAPVGGSPAVPPQAPVAPVPGAPTGPTAPGVPVASPQPPAAPKSELAWVSFPEAIPAGKKAKRPIILYFTNDSSAVRKFEMDIFENPQVKQTLQNFVLARISVVESKDVARKYDVSVYPTLVFLGPDGYTRSRIDGVPAAQTLQKELSRFVK